MQEMVAVMGRRERGQERLVGGSRKGEKIGEGKMECLSMRAHCLSPPGSGQLLFSSNVGRTPPSPPPKAEDGGGRRADGSSCWEGPAKNDGGGTLPP